MQCFFLLYDDGNGGCVLKFFCFQFIIDQINWLGVYIDGVMFGRINGKDIVLKRNICNFVVEIFNMNIDIGYIV